MPYIFQKLVPTGWNCIVRLRLLPFPHWHSLRPNCYADGEQCPGPLLCSQNQSAIGLNVVVGWCWHGYDGLSEEIFTYKLNKIFIFFAFIQRLIKSI
jgi:hypothetical protein